MKCVNCKETIPNNSKFCNFCGEEQEKITAETYKKRRFNFENYQTGQSTKGLE